MAGDPNFGIIYSTSEVGSTAAAAYIFSSDHSDASKRPKLEITYY